ncbi:IQ calmodulin-binding motif-containing protein 1-like [Crassostrea angulata]|uniref:IQ calmodulin-binding motif-containing protein 1-like n=1 Tax=Magallana angulata TaxID=2784310 RepID=UPI0022B1C7C8|nr:IQ calmodulin-binding motif-containing protein 1-like [Crassostrea angulata]
MSARLRSPVRDKRIINLAAEIAETKDRGVPALLLNLREILASAPKGTKDGIRVRNECWEFNILQVLVLVLKQDFSIVDGDWQTAAALAAILSQICLGIDLDEKSQKSKFSNEFLPEAVSNLFLITRRIQARHSYIPDRPSLQKDRQRLMMCYKGVLESVAQITYGYPELASTVLECPWLLQLLISDDPSTVSGIMELLPKILRCNKNVMQDIDKKLKFSIMDELIYKLSVNTDATIASAATKCVLKICDIHKPMIDVVCSRYKGLKFILTKWDNAGFGRDLRELMMMLQAGNAKQAESERFARAATVIQTIWRGFIARKKLQKANKAFSKFQNTYRRKQRIMGKRKEEAKVAMELERRLKLNRQKIMREFKEKQLHTIEILPAAHVEKYMQNEQIQAAVKIQRIWRGHNCRQSIDQRKVLIQRYKAAIILQRGVRKWLEKVRKKRERFQFTIKPPGLTENRRVELQQKITQYREENPPQYSKREDLEKVHKKAAEMLQRHYVTLKSTREKHAHREALLARLDTDSELLSLAPPLKDAREKDIEMYSSNLLPIATKARTDHIETLRLLRQPWWKKLRDDLQDQEYEEEDYILF